jgi:hypothetical protein
VGPLIIFHGPNFELSLSLLFTVHLIILSENYGTIYVLCMMFISAHIMIFSAAKS